MNISVMEAICSKKYLDGYFVIKHHSLNVSTQGVLLSIVTIGAVIS